MNQPVYQSAFRPGLFAGQTVIVTGGGSGIGRCTAHELANLGAVVALVGRRVEMPQRRAHARWKGNCRGNSARCCA